jgi:hypothetical protein
MTDNLAMTPGQFRRAQRNERIRAAVAAGRSRREVAKAYGMSRKNVDLLTRGIGPDRRRKYDHGAVIAAIRAGTHFAEVPGVPYNTVYRIIRNYEALSGERLPRAGYGVDPAFAVRRAEIVAAYLATPNLHTVGKRFGMTGERVRQIVVRHEAETGETVPRGKRAGKRGPRVARVLWRCAGCGEERMLPPNLAARNSTICRKCTRIHLTDWLIENTIKRVIAGEKFMPISIAAGYSPTSQALTLSVYTHLFGAGRFDEIALLWPRGVPNWLRKRHKPRPVAGTTFATDPPMTVIGPCPSWVRPIFTLAEWMR